jgi:myosin heavy subunit
MPFLGTIFIMFADPTDSTLFTCFAILPIACQPPFVQYIETLSGIFDPAVTTLAQVSVVVTNMENPAHLSGVGDMTQLIHLDADNVLCNLQVRYERSEIYSSISKVLLAMNPYRNLAIYDDAAIRRYRAHAEAQIASAIVKPLPPHVYSISQMSYLSLLRTNENQSIIVCGESGSGKTESAKHLLRYLAFSPEGTSSLAASLQAKVIAANPILEAFGNAKTVLNDNSSRFGKFTKAVYEQDQGGAKTRSIAGSFIETYLLERSRVVHQDPGERNYHIFYMLTCPGALTPAQNEELVLADASNFRYTNQSGCFSAGRSDLECYTELCTSLHALGMGAEKMKHVFQVAAAVLHLGNIEFTDESDASVPISDGTLDTAAQLLGVDAHKLRQRLSTSTIRSRGEVIEKTFSQEKACENRDAMAKAIYHGLFEWLVKEINESLYTTSARQTSAKWIGILDVFGMHAHTHTDTYTHTNQKHKHKHTNIHAKTHAHTHTHTHTHTHIHKHTHTHTHTHKHTQALRSSRTTASSNSASTSPTSAFKASSTRSCSKANSRSIRRKASCGSPSLLRATRK